MEWKEAILQYIENHKEEMIRDICDLIRIDSTRKEAEEGMPYGKGNAEVLALALEKARAYGFQTSNYDNHVGTVDLNQEPRQLDILAHLDVVPASPEEWKITQPFEGKVYEGKLYGRGAADDKGPAVMALYAMRAVKDLQIPLKKNVRLILGCNEETGSADIAHYYKKEQAAPVTLSPDAEFPVIHLEKGRFSGCCTAKVSQEKAEGPYISEFKAGTQINVIPGKALARVWGIRARDILPYVEEVRRQTKVAFTLTDEKDGCVITSIGVSGHASLPEQANNALTALLQLLMELPLAKSDMHEYLAALQGVFPHGDFRGKSSGIQMQDAKSGSLTISLNTMEMNASAFCAAFDCRLPLGTTRDELVGKLEKKLSSLGLELVGTTWTDPHYVPEETPFIQELLRIYEAYTGRAGKCLAIGGGTYVHGLPNGVAFGPVELETETNLHSADENIPLVELYRASAIYAEVIATLCG